MMRLFHALIVLFVVAATVRADEGMWLLNQLPKDLLKKKYDFDLTDAWRDRAMKASIRFNNGGSGSFVSPNGLAITNHHIGSDLIQKLSTKEKDYYRSGFLARTLNEELKCPDLELNVLQEIIDVTKEVQDAVKPDMKPADALAARKAIMAKITKDSLAKTGLRSDVVTLYHGGMYHLYRYKKYTDVRLVMAPEHQIAFFGGDSDNFEYPRYNLDICFFRVYENGKPIKTPDYFKFSATGPKDGDLVFVSGHPGTTNRLETYDHIVHRRTVTLPYMLQMLRYREALLTQYAEKGKEQRRWAQRDLFPVANARKALTGQYHGLLDPAIMAEKKKLEAKLKPKDLKPFQGPWESILQVQNWMADFEADYYLIERGDAFDSRLFRIARNLVRLADELPKDDAIRLPEYRSSALDSLKLQLFSPAPISKEYERMKLTGSLYFLAEHKGNGNASLLLPRILHGKSIPQLVDTAIDGTKLDDVAERKRLFEGSRKAIAESKDSMIALARLVDSDGRDIRGDFDENDEIRTQAYADIAKIRFAKFGASIAPDATFTLRLAFGTVQGYEVDGVKLGHATTFDQMFARAKEQEHHHPFDLPKRWLDGKDKLDPKTPFNFVSTADTIGVNSGSPVLNRNGEFVGINFDRNRHGLVRNFVYTDHQARHISVHSKAIVESLRKLYDADGLVQELV
ncbi:MAG: S46 family peptidase, partial [Planctomycetes bacterium]|nr:S46 family peptidase [Planctomycetota bacterium]